MRIIIVLKIPCKRGVHNLQIGNNDDPGDAQKFVNGYDKDQYYVPSQKTGSPLISKRDMREQLGFLCLPYGFQAGNDRHSDGFEKVSKKEHEGTVGILMFP